MSAVSSETFVSSMSRDVLEDCLAVLFQENKANLESGASANAEVIYFTTQASSQHQHINTETGI